MAGNSVKALFYGINGTGLGHISRLLNIAREAREVLHALRLRADFHFVTTTEAPQLAWDFPVYKLPSKTVIRGCDTDNEVFSGNTQFLITNLAVAVRPELLIMDTMSQGSFGEFMQLRGYAKKTVFINRRKKPEAARDPVHLNHLPLYDLILTPDEPENESRHIMPNRLRDRNAFTGIIHGYRPEESLNAIEVRTRFGVPADRKLVYVSAGGGGDRQAAEDLRRLVLTLADRPDAFVLVGYGPLYRGEMVYRPNVVPLTAPDTRRLFGGIDLAFSAAGYNTYNELLAAGVPTAFFFQEKGMDDQEERVRTGAANGWNSVLESLDQESILDRFNHLASAETADGYRQRLSQRGLPFGATRAAVELLRLHAAIKGTAVNPRLAVMAGLMRQGWQQAAMKARLEPDSPEAHPFPESFQALTQWWGLTMGPYEQMRFEEKAQAAWIQRNRLEDTAAWMRLGSALAAAAGPLGPRQHGFRKALQSLARNHGQSTEPLTDKAINSLIGELNEIWTPPEREAPAIDTGTETRTAVPAAAIICKKEV